MPATDAIPRLLGNLEKVISGKRRVLRSVLTGFFAGGHLLIEDVPGIGKTILARALARSVSGVFKRIQFTPDLLPTDVMGVSIYEPSTQKFAFKPGPLFAHILLADEINRATPKTQSSLLEAMAEEQVTVDGQTYGLPRPFFVMATQNPLESQGTYPLPEAQLDRFLMKLRVGYPDQDTEVKILTDQKLTHPIESLQPVCTPQDILAVQDLVKRIHVSPELLEYTVRVVAATREHPYVHVGSSPRGSLGLRRASQAAALQADRDYVTPDDIKDCASPVLAHRLVLKHQALLEGKNGETVMKQVLRSVPVEETDRTRG
ncbi:MAG: MoxR family ATPase [Candidatus Riflebacteria bacterium]|nr:MoxR family ATPase [Candidatus Riflebacteria bacterium]